MAAALVLAVCAGASHAQGLAEQGLRVSGFGTVGAVATRGESPGWRLYRDWDQPSGTAPVSWNTDSRLGVQASYPFTPRWEAVVQAVLREKSSGLRAANAVEWAFVRYSLMDRVEVKVGRVAQSSLLMTGYRHVGFGYPWMRPPSDLYTASPLSSLDGADVVVGHPLAHGRWEWGASLGQRDIDFTIDGNASQMRYRNIWRLSASWQDERWSLRAGVVGANGLMLLGAPGAALNATLSGVASAPTLSAGARRQALELQQMAYLAPQTLRFFTLAARYEHGPWLMQAEAVKRLATGLPTGSHGAYAALAWRHGPWTPYATAGFAQAESPAYTAPDWSALGPQASALAVTMAQYANSVRMSQHSIALGSRWDLNTRTALKLQVEQTWVHADGAGAWRQTGGTAQRVRALSAAVDFIF